MAEKKETTLDDAEEDSSVVVCNMFRFFDPEDDAVEVKLILPLLRVEWKDRVIFNGPAINEMNGRHNTKNNKNRVRKMDLSHLKATITRTKQLIGQGFRRFTSWYLYAVNMVFTNHICRVKNASSVPLMCVVKVHLYEFVFPGGHNYGVTHRWMLFDKKKKIRRWIVGHELMPGDYMDVRCWSTRGTSVSYACLHVYPKIAGEFPFHMYGSDEDKIVYPNGVKAVDVAGFFKAWCWDGPCEMSLTWKGKGKVIGHVMGKEIKSVIY
ncbi:uncharacterized protein LOC120285948 [Eucalyptus grandis]|uniref:uncharacterized protein LOC120285948 n=1 Tax=Eucalyptus grandis TaxID=71139 RepID=UPI00192EEF45|nr:uncharacterized protein LOC120285948 [Eucalyptus grandis]